MKNKSMKGQFTVIIAALSLTLVLAGACTKSHSSTEKPVVIVQCNSYTEDFLRSIEKQCPDIEIKWFYSRNSHANYYNHLKEKPDILSIGAFYYDANPDEYVRDIASEVYSSDYSRNIIDNFKNVDGSISWVPVVGNAYFILANKAIFEKYGVALPHDYKSLVEADKAFKRHGIDGMGWGLSNEWPLSMMVVAQALAADLFNSYDGMLWRKSFTEYGPDVPQDIDARFWQGVFKRMEDVIREGLIDSNDIKESTTLETQRFMFDKAAMILCSTSSMSLLKNENSVVIPLFDTQGTAWVPLAIRQNIAVSASVSDERLPYVMEVFRAIQSNESLKAYNDSRGGAYPLRNDPKGIPDGFENLKEPTANGYSFMLFNEFNSGVVQAFKTAADAMVSERIDAGEAYSRYKENIPLARERNTSATEWMDDDPEHLLFTSDVSYPMITDSNHNNPAASCLANTMLSSINSLSDTKFDVLVTLPEIVASPIQKGGYYYDVTKTNGSNFYLLFNARKCFYPATMTAGELIQKINNSFYYFHRVDDGLPVLAGVSYVVEKYEDGIEDAALPFKPGNINAGKVANLKNFPTRYVCKAIMMDGKELDPDTVLEVLVARENVFFFTEMSEEWESTWVGFRPAISLKDGDGNDIRDYLSFVKHWVEQGNPLCAPTRYLYLKEAGE